MADNEQEIQQEVPTEEQTGNAQEQPDTTEVALTQAQVDAIVSQRVNEIKEQSAAELRAVREQTEATIRGYQQAFQSLQAPKAVEEDDDPTPANLTPDQKYMWDVNKPMRVMMKRQMQALESKVSQSLNPVLQDSTVQSFFRGKTGIPEHIKTAVSNEFTSAMNDPRSMSARPEQVLQAVYIKILAEEQEKLLFGQGGVGARNAGTGNPNVKPQPRVVAPNGGTDFGGGIRAGIPGRVGPSKKNQTWQEIQADLIANNEFPEGKM